MIKTIKTAFSTAQETLNSFVEDSNNISQMQRIVAALARVYASGGKCIIFGNGGSMCDAMHFAEEFTGRFRKDRPALPCIAIADPSHITCVGNDYGFDEIFSRGVEAYAKADDFVVGISTSGNSPNVIRGLQVAKDRGCFTFALLGKDGGKLKDFCDFELIVAGDTADRIQEVHTLILHTIIQCVEKELYPELI